MTTIGVSEALVRRETVSAPPLIGGVDTLRFFAALWVVFGHGAHFPLEQLVNVDHGVLWAVIKLAGTIYNGTAAVVVFFIISGFCIHYPNAGKDTIDWRTFIVRRFLRIGVPLVAIIVFVHLMGPSYVDSESAVLWTIYCELSYYALYPIIFLFSKRWGMRRILLGSAIISFGMIVTNPRNNYLWQFGRLTWLFCAPLWLLGATLAESYKAGARVPSFGSIWLWRGVAILGGVAMVLLLYKAPITIGYPWTMPLFGVYSVYWLGVEFEFFSKNPPWSIFEKLGAFSYSMYLMHKPVLTFFLENMTGFGIMAYWIIQLVVMFMASYLFYLLLERPAHNFARRLRLSPQPVVPSIA